jgi:hypothetical protein
VTLDAHGSAWITMPDYFEALNRLSSTLCDSTNLNSRSRYPLTSPFTSVRVGSLHPSHMSAFVWKNGTMIALPTLGGNNGAANYMNNHSQVAGLAENTTLDSTCPSSEYQANCEVGR